IENLVFNQKLRDLIVRPAIKTANFVRTLYGIRRLFAVYSVQTQAYLPTAKTIRNANEVSSLLAVLFAVFHRNRLFHPKRFSAEGLRGLSQFLQINKLPTPTDQTWRLPAVIRPVLK